MSFLKETLCSFTNNLIYCIDKQNFTLAFLRFVHATYDYTRCHRGVVKEVWSQYTFHLIIFYQSNSHLLLLVAEEDAVREEDGAATALWIHAGDDVLEEGIVGAS